MSAPVQSSDRTSRSGELRLPPAQSAAGHPPTAVEPEPTAPVLTWDLVSGECGPGTRFVVYTAGCPLRCVYCDLPQAWNERAGRRTGVRDVMAHVRRYAPLFELTGGGVTLSGGEPLLHPGFTAALLRACKREGVHTALDTSGALGMRLADDALLDIDLTLLDLKAFQADAYHRLTRGEVAPSLHFARRLARLGRPVLVRFVLVPELTDRPAEIDALADFVAELGTVQRVDVVPFHRRGEVAWNELGLDFPLAGWPGPTREALATVRAVFRERGLAVG
jgi:pyruvate formate lyase activating enzyme